MASAKHNGEALSDPQAMMDVADWDALMNAVKIRLSLTAGELAAHSADPVQQAAAVRFRASVLECVEALEQLQVQFNQELDKSRQLKDEVQEAKSALVKARDDLVGMQAGERRARHRASHDSLTMLPNRSLFHQRLTKVLATLEASGHWLAVAYIDLDGFKRINDTRGHAVGDKLLQVVAARLNQAVRVEDVVCRLGGDEFACMLGGVSDPALLRELASKLFAAVAGPCRIGDLEVPVTPSIGIALWPQHGKTPDALLKCADAAMYRAKRLKAGYAFYDPAVDLEVVRK